MALSYSASIDFLYGLQKYGIKLGLDNIAGLLTRLGHPERRFPSLHIGGTNGKGSTAAMAAAVFQEEGLRVGLYTSPHLVDFRERIRVNGQPISDEGVSELTERLQLAAALGPTPTFFEFTTALAFQYFADSAVDVAVVEVGMGGRFDATNVLAPLASGITNVALDHQDHLGHTVEAIAFEKAGIIKPGVPVVIGRMAPEAMPVIEQVAADRGASCFLLGRDFRICGESPAQFRYEGLQATHDGLALPLRGAHQLENAACAMALLELAAKRGLPVTERAIRAGLSGVRWEGRLEVVEERPRLVIDGAHNPAAAEVVAAYLRSHRIQHPESRVVLVIGMMRDKDRDGFFRVVLPYADDIVLTQAAMPRAATIEELRPSLGDRAASGHGAPLVADALALARRLAAPEDVICVTGSLMLVGELKALLRGCELSPIRG